MPRGHVIFAVFKRNVSSYFSGVLGYLFIVVFVVAGSMLAFNTQFFADNVASLDQLSRWFPMLLLFIVPAITMGAWADEKKLGTDELLFTLPASDFEILLGKYLAVLAAYTIALVFSLMDVVVLGMIGNPDYGVVFSTYLGYWLAGAALLSAGMFASVLTRSATVAFILGVAICAIPVFIGHLPVAGDFVRQLSIQEQLRDFTTGVVPLSGILYFVSLTAFMFYLNLVFITKRHWSSGRQAGMGLQFALRAVCLAVILVSWNVLAGEALFRGVRGDLTAEKLYSLSPTTREILDHIDKDRPVDVTVYLSPVVPREYVETRKRLVGLLREFHRIAGGRLTLRFVSVEPSSKEAEEAKLVGIRAVPVTTERDGRRTQRNIYLGAVVSSSFDEVVIPFFGRSLPVEYELTRSVGTVSNEKRLTIGILTTDAHVMTPSAEWQVVTELKKQYKVEQVSPDAKIDENKYSVLLAVLPSSLTQPQMKNLADYVNKGKPVLICDDPYPYVFSTRFGVRNAPRQPKPRPGGMMGMRSPPPPPKADGGKDTQLLRALDIAWDNGQVVWDLFDPHPKFAGSVPEEFLFISPKSGTKTAFNPDSPVTAGMQEMLLAFAGTVRPRKGSDLVFQPLLRTSKRSGLENWEEFTRQGFDPTTFQPSVALRDERPRAMDSYSHVLAAHITSTDKKRKRNVIFVADIDLISDWFFHERAFSDAELNFDNVPFILNAVDVLAGDDRYIELRKRRGTKRSLTRVEMQTAQFRKQRTKEQEKAVADAKKELQAAKDRFATRRQEIEDDKSLSPRTKQLMLRNLQETESRRVAVAEANINDEKKARIDSIKARTERQVRATERYYQWISAVIPPIPAVVLGLVVFAGSLYNERRDISTDRLVKRH